MKFITGRSFRYDIQECDPHYYQVEGFNNPATSGQGGGYVVTTVLACDPTDICAALKAQGQSLTIKKVLKINKPATDTTSSLNPTDATQIQIPNCPPAPTPTPKSQTLLPKKRQKDVRPLSYGDTHVPSVPVHTVGDSTGGGGGLKLPSARDYAFTATGGFTLAGDPTLAADFDGDLETDITVTASLEGEAVTAISRGKSPAATIPLQTGGITVPCCQGPIPVILEFKHNLNLIAPFARFLRQNNLTMVGTTASETDFVKLNYSDRTNSWVGNMHYAGDSTTGTGTETWDFNVSFGCMNTGTWNFSVSAAQVKSQKLTAKLAVGFPTTAVCKLGTFIKLPFSYSNGVTVPAGSVVVNDDPNFFRNLRLLFNVYPQETMAVTQLEEDNTAAYNATMGDS